MRYSGIATLAFASGVAAHSRMYSVWVNGVDQGDGRSVYIRSPATNDPVKDVSSSDLACNTAGATAVSDFVTAAAGDTLTSEWYHDSRGDDIIASSHLGPIITYIAPYTESMDGTGSIWTKIAEEGYDASTDKWAVDNLISNKGKKDFTIPSDLAAGKYMFRQEIIALHEADVSHVANSARGAQFYPSCFQVEVTGSGTASPSENFALPGGYTETDPGVVFNLYSTYTSYTIPGPAVWDGASSGSSASTTTAAAATTAAATTSAAATSTQAPVTSSQAATTTAAAATPTTMATSVKTTAAAATTSAAASTSSAAAASSAAPTSSGKPTCQKKKRRSVRH